MLRKGACLQRIIGFSGGNTRGKRGIKRTKRKEKNQKNGASEKAPEKGPDDEPLFFCNGYFLSEGDHGLGGVDLEGKGLGQEETYFVSAALLKTEGKILPEDELEVSAPERDDERNILA